MKKLLLNEVIKYFYDINFKIYNLTKIIIYRILVRMSYESETGYICKIYILKYIRMKIKSYNRLYYPFYILSLIFCKINITECLLLKNKILWYNKRELWIVKTTRKVKESLKKRSVFVERFHYHSYMKRWKIDMCHNNHKKENYMILIGKERSG